MVMVLLRERFGRLQIPHRTKNDKTKKNTFLMKVIDVILG